MHDLDASLQFYARLGIHETFRIHHDDGPLMLVYLHVAGDRFIELYPAGPGTPPMPAPEDFGPHIDRVLPPVPAQRRPAR